MKESCSGAPPFTPSPPPLSYTHVRHGFEVIGAFSFSIMPCSSPLRFAEALLLKAHVLGLLTRLQPHAEAMQEIKLAISSKITQHIVSILIKCVGCWMGAVVGIDSRRAMEMRR